MRSFRFFDFPSSLVATFLAVLVAAVTAAGCGSANKCGPTTCVGCCDTDGVCQQGATNAVCGANGAACQTCSFDQFCQAGVCFTSGNTGGKTDAGVSDAGDADGGDAGDGDGGADGGDADGGGDAGFDGGADSGVDGGTDGGADGGFDGGLDAGTDGGADAGNAVPNIQALCDEMTKAYCEFAVRCGYAHSATTCTAENGPSGLCAADYQAAEKDARLSFDGAKARKCMDFIGKTYACKDVSVAISDLNADCSDMLLGKVANGGSCFRDAECAATSYCNTASTCPGTCQPRKGVGQSTTATSHCAPGLYHYGGDSTCRAYVAAGGNCAPLAGTQPQECVGGYYCASATLTCQPQKSAGANCLEFNECLYPSFCSNGKCAAYQSVGQTCGNGAFCKYDLACQYASSTSSGACGLKQPLGGPCFGDDACTFGTMCVGGDFPSNTKGTCQSKKMLGQSCSGVQCTYPGLYCSASGTCAAQKGLGSSCFIADECTSLSCNGGICTVGSGCYDPTP